MVNGRRIRSDLHWAVERFDGVAFESPGLIAGDFKLERMQRPASGRSSIAAVPPECSEGRQSALCVECCA